MRTRCLLVALSLSSLSACLTGEIIADDVEEAGEDPPELVDAKGDGLGLGNPKATFRSLSLALGGTCVVKSDGATSCWGLNAAGRVGSGVTGADVRSPAAVKALGTATDIDTGTWHTCAVVQPDGLVKCWGDNGHGQLGNGTMVSSATPVVVSGIAGAVSVAVGMRHSCALEASGQVRCWGNNWKNQLGGACGGSQCNRPVMIGAGYGFVAIDAGHEHTCGLTSAGAVYCWGSSELGASGVASGVVVQPRLILGAGSTTAIAVARWTTCALGTDATVRCFGANLAGQLGFTPDTYAHPVPTAVSGLTAARTIAVADDHACATLSSGATRCWGTDDLGQLGNATLAAYLPPVTVSGGLSFARLEAGGSHTCGVTTSAELHCWGRGVNGELGLGTTSNAWAPVRVTP